MSRRRARNLTSTRVGTQMMSTAASWATLVSNTATSQRRCMTANIRITPMDRRITTQITPRAATLGQITSNPLELLAPMSFTIILTNIRLLGNQHRINYFSAHSKIIIMKALNLQIIIPMCI